MKKLGDYGGRAKPSFQSVVNNLDLDRESSGFNLKGGMFCERCCFGSGEHHSGCSGILGMPLQPDSDSV